MYPPPPPPDRRLRHGFNVCKYCRSKITRGQIRCDSCGAPVLETKPIGKLEAK